MRYEHDAEADAVYVRLRDGPYSHGRELDDSRRVDYGIDGKPVGIELLNVSLGVNLDDLPQAKQVAKILASHGIKVFA